MAFWTKLQVQMEPIEYKEKSTKKTTKYSELRNYNRHRQDHH